MSGITYSFIIGLFIGIILIIIFEVVCYLRSWCLKRKIYNLSDKRSFDCSEVIWYNGKKFYIQHITVWSDSLNIDLVIQPVGYGISFLTTRVDSREVKKVVKLYAKL